MREFIAALGQSPELRGRLRGRENPTHDSLQQMQFYQMILVKLNDISITPFGLLLFALAFVALHQVVLHPLFGPEQLTQHAGTRRFSWCQDGVGHKRVRESPKHVGREK